jgi:hypothetical protein
MAESPSIPSTYAQWCTAHGVSHGHCPRGHDKPQPIIADDGRCLCAGCLCVDGLEVEVIPCTPDVCD